ncbi:MAG: MBL fold metallo-hydrolase [Muribaculaceae bacterium]|nr:MBL fold metallo-hydrolase [Muribaculaceae bacterium]
MAKPTNPRRRRVTRELENLPNLFDSVEIDMTRHDIAGPALQRATAREEEARRERNARAADAGSVDISENALRRAEAVRFISFGSGSSGNCAYIGTRRGGLLIDAGVDAKTVTEQLNKNGIDIATIAGIVLTHDHSDHVRFAYTLLRANRHLQLFCTPRTLSGLLRRHSISRRIKDYHKPIYKEIPFEAGGFTVTAFETSHDGSDNMGFAIDRGPHHFVVATDTGFITDRANHYLRLATCAMIETDYDLGMLQANPVYPEYLKARIAGRTGHMCNDDTAAYLAALLAEKDPETGRRLSPLTHIFLCHLSEENNTPDTALRAVRRALEQAGLTVGDATGSPVSRSADIQLAALPRYTPSPLHVFR